MRATTVFVDLSKMSAAKSNQLPFISRTSAVPLLEVNVAVALEPMTKTIVRNTADTQGDLQDSRLKLFLTSMILTPLGSSTA